MLKQYFLLCLLCVFFRANSQSVLKYNEDSFSFNQLNDSLDNASREDGSYQYFLQLYLNKSKKEQNASHLFEAYYRLSSYEPSAEMAHIYADSLFEVAEKLPELYYIRALQTKATNYYYEKDYINSLKYELQALNKIDQEKEPYVYYKSIYSVGLVYFHIQEYSKAYHYFNQARVYYQASADYSHVQGYFNSLYREAFALYYLKNYAESTHLIQTGLTKKHLLKPNDAASKISYFNYVLALNLYRQKHFTESIALLKDQISTLDLKNDFANLATLYYYMGLNCQQLNNKEEAVVYFKKVDSIFKYHVYSNPEIKEAYSCLIAYYRELNNTKSELYYTNRMIEVLQFLQTEYQLLSNSLHYNFDINSLQNDKQRLENDLNSKNLYTRYFILLGIAIVLCLLFITVYNFRKKKEFLKNYNDLLQQRAHLPAPLPANEKEAPAYSTVHSLAENHNEWVNYTLPAFNEIKEAPAIDGKILKELMGRLHTFEETAAFLNKEISLNDLAQQWNTNRSYLSQFINSYKEKSFTDYLNGLRIAYFLDKVDTDKRWHKYKIQAVAEQLGFSSARSFSAAFLKTTGMSPSFYLQQVSLDPNKK